jgi:hypothetical protein
VILSVKGVDFFVIGNKQAGKELWYEKAVLTGTADIIRGR